jgi:hypothetical protein
MTPDPVHFIQTLLQYLLMAGGLSIVIVSGTIAGFTVAAERKRAQGRSALMTATVISLAAYRASRKPRAVLPLVAVGFVAFFVFAFGAFFHLWAWWV